MFVAAEQRPVGVVFQDYLLFAHLSALENVAFGLRARGDAQARTRASAPASGSSGSGSPTTPVTSRRALSGGQAQRVALARALATEPRLLLLDEPLAALDAGTRGEVRRDLRRHLAAFDGMRLLVTHDPLDAYALADRVVVLEAGRVVQTGTLADVTAHPRSALRRRPGRHEPARRHTRRPRAHHADGRDHRDRVRPARGEAFAAIRPQAISLHLEHPDGSPRNTWRCVVADVDRLADRVRVTLEGEVPLVAEITPAALVALELRPGDPVWAAVKASEVTSYPM